MSKFGKRIVLIHKLGELGRAEEFFNSGNDRANIDKILGGNNIGVLSGHAFFDNAFHTAHTNTELILKKFADGADTAVAKMVNIVFKPRVAHKGEDVINSGDNIGNAKCAVIGNGKSRGTKHSIVAGIGFNTQGDRKVETSPE